MSNPPAFGSGFSFGANNNNNNTNTNPGQPASGAQTNIFGGAASTTTGNTFGGFGNNAATGGAGAQQPKPSLFGGFGAAATTPASGTTPTATTGGNTFGGGGAFGGSGGSIFGKPAASAATTTGTPSGGLFGNTAATAPSTGGNLFSGGNMFGAKPTTTTPGATAGTSTAPNATSTAAPSLSLFGNTTKPAESSANTANIASAAPMFGGFSKPANAPAGNLFGNIGSATPSAPTLFGATSNAATAQKPAAGAAPAPPAGGLFGALGGASSNKEPAKDSSTKPTETTSAAPVSTNLFGGMGLGKPPGVSTSGAAPLFDGFNPPTSQDKGKEPAKPAAPLFGGAAPAKAPEASTAATPTTNQASSSAPATNAATTAGNEKPPLIPPSVLKGKTMEEIVNQWNVDLESQVKEFQRLAGEVEVWDRVLNDNAKQISNVYAMVLQAETTQAKVEASLDQIESQQNQVASNLEDFTKLMETPSVQEGLGIDIGAADSEREKNYALATSLNTQMDELARSLSAMIDEVNFVTAPTHSTGIKPADNTNSLGTSASQRQMLEDDADPMLQIQSILNAHLESLTWINGTVKELEEKVVDLEKKFGTALPDNSPAPPISRSSTRGLMSQRTVLEGSAMGGSSRYGGSSVYGFNR
ncbi:FG-nucleoporin nsp1 [Tulasnella sp. JGI-2019a]|nr:FG-nucleoporin nsp1 [Tulasnella sp. JGI-2019a]